MRSDRKAWNRGVFARRRRALRLSMREIREELIELAEEAQSQGLTAPKIPCLAYLYRQCDARGCRGPVDRSLGAYLARVVNLKEEQLWT